MQEPEGGARGGLPPVDLACAVADAPRLGAAPPLLHQHWDRDPPGEVARMLEHNAPLSTRWGVAHRVWDHGTGRALLSRYALEHLGAFDAAPHPAMAADLLRLAIVHAQGGHWLDADMALRPEGRVLFDLLGEGLLVQWDVPERRTMPNWCSDSRKDTRWRGTSSTGRSSRSRGPWRAMRPPRPGRSSGSAARRASPARARNGSSGTALRRGR